MGVLVFDGGCGFCTSAATVLRERIRTADRVIASQDADLVSLGITRAQADEAVQHVDDTGIVTSGARAIAATLRSAPGAWPAIGACMDAPPVRPLAARVYALVARNRHRLPGATCGTTSVT